ncbi:hypothetical protein FBU30_009723 [Linnemannia zychae]|nr:hypothetical protein FBU30_009723 [Linnemannia zychae]
MQQQQYKRQQKSKHSKQSSYLPGTAPYLRILFPKNIQHREPVPQLLSHPHPDLDAEAYHFLALLVRDFIQTWYSTFSSDPQLVTSIVNVVIEIARELERRSQEMDWVGLLLLDIPEILRRHYIDYRQAIQKLETAYAPNQTIESAFHGLQPHFALQDGEESEKEYLRQLADELLRILLPKAEYESDCVRWLIREILACLVLRSLVEILTEPDMINYIVNTLLQDFEPTDIKYEAFLQKAADQMDASDENFSAFLASLGGSKGKRNFIHRSSTPNINPTDEMVDLLQDAQTSSLAAAAAAASFKNAGISQTLAWIYAELDEPEHSELEAGIFRLAKEIFYLEERNQVIWRQWELMGWPLVRTLGGGAIDRVLAHGVYWIFAEPRLVTYIQAGRRALWPDPTSSPLRPRGVDEMEKARREAERRILRAIPAQIRDTFFGEQGIHHLAAAKEALEPFQNKQCNKHLIYIALDLLLSKITPEVYPDRI